MDHFTDSSVESNPLETRTHIEMSTVTNPRPGPTSSAPQRPGPTSSEARSTREPTRQPSSSAPPPSSSGEPEPTSEPDPEPTSTPEPSSSPSTSEPPPPPSTSSEPSSKPTPSSSIVPPTTSSDLPSSTLSLDPTTTSSLLSTSTLPSTTSSTPITTIRPLPTPSGLSLPAKIGLGAGLGGAFLLVLIMALIHFGRKRYANHLENKQRVQDIEDNAQLAAFQAQMSQGEQVAPRAAERRGSAMYGIHPTRFGDVEERGVRRSQGYQAYSPRVGTGEGYRGFSHGVN